MADLYEIRADFDGKSIVMYQAYGDAIADVALRHQKFVHPFSFHRMTWIKPSFLWLMHRSQWAKKRNQERILAVRMSIEGLYEALENGVHTSPGTRIHSSHELWEEAFENASVHVQWDTERSLRGTALSCYSIQIGLGRAVIERFATDWIVSIEDYTTRVHKIRGMLDSGKTSAIKRLLPPEKHFSLKQSIIDRIVPSGR